jgi:hypothetical protein
MIYRGLDAMFVFMWNYSVGSTDGAGLCLWIPATISINPIKPTNTNHRPEIASCWLHKPFVVAAGDRIQRLPLSTGTN